MESIGSGEVFPNVELSVGRPPAHTDPEHIFCMYYHAGPLECGHGKEAAGGFVSEDFFNAIRHNTHVLLDFIDKNIEFKANGYAKDGRLERKYIPNDSIAEFKALVEVIRNLTK